jgi:hypothetical protein
MIYYKSKSNSINLHTLSPATMFSPKGEGGFSEQKIRAKDTYNMQGRKFSSTDTGNLRKTYRVPII